MSDKTMQFCVTHMAPRVWTGEDNCVYRASWKASYPDPCKFEWMRFSFDAEPEEAAELAEVLEVAIARGEQLGYADVDYRKRLNQLVGVLPEALLIPLELPPTEKETE